MSKPSSLLITVTNVIARGAHLLLFLAVGNLFGATDITDTVLLLQAPLVILVAVVSGAAEVIVMPAIHRGEQHGCAHSLYRQLLLRGLVFMLPFTLLAAAIGFYIAVDATLTLALLVSPIPLLATTSAIHMGLLNARGHHRLAMLGPLYGAALALPLFFIPVQSAAVLACIFLVFEMGRSLSLWLHARQLTRGEESASPESQRLLEWASKGALIQALGSLFIASNILVDDLFASQLGESAVTLVEYANRLWNIVPLLLSGQLIVAYAVMSKQASVASVAPADVHKKALRLGVIALILSLAAILASPLFIDIVYGLGTMSKSTRSDLAHLLSLYLMGAGPFVAGLVYVRAYSAQGKPHIIMIVSGVGLIANTVLNALLVPVFGVDGIGMATSLAYSFNTLLLLYFMMRTSMQQAK